MDQFDKNMIILFTISLFVISGSIVSFITNLV
jgi:hypothetical protein